jgi:hypothetical protein
MIKNKSYEDACRVDSIKNRTKTYNPKTIQWVKKCISGGQFVKKSLLLKNIVIRNSVWEQILCQFQIYQKK